MKPGDLVQNKNSLIGEYGLFMGFKESCGYKYAEVMWFNRSAPNGQRVCTIQPNLICKVPNASR